jgi:hypothetical protein
MSTSTNTIPAPSTGANTATIVEPDAEIQRLTAQLDELTSAYDALRNGIHPS